MLDKALTGLVRPPTKSILGTKLRKIKPVMTVPEVLQEAFSTERGFPEDDSKSKIVRSADGNLIPESSTPTVDKFNLRITKLEEMTSFFRLGQRCPARGLETARLRLSAAKAARGVTGKMVAMAAPPLVVRASVPKGKAALSSLATITIKTNVVTMDENANVTMGATEYPEKMQQKLRAKIWGLYLSMGVVRAAPPPKQPLLAASTALSCDQVCVLRANTLGRMR